MDADKTTDISSPGPAMTKLLSGRLFHMAGPPNIKQEMLAANAEVTSTQPAIKREDVGGSFDRPIVIDSDNDTELKSQATKGPPDTSNNALVPEALEFRSVDHLAKQLQEWRTVHVEGEKLPGGLRYNKESVKECPVRLAAIGNEVGTVQRFKIDQQYMGWMLRRPNGNVLYIRRPVSLTMAEYSVWLGGDRGFSIKFRLSGHKGDVQIQEVTQEQGNESSAASSDSEDDTQSTFPDSPPDYAVGVTTAKCNARKIISEGKLASTSCQHCIDLNLECIVKEGSSKCAYCTSLSKPVICTAVGENTVESNGPDTPTDQPTPNERPEPHFNGGGQVKAPETTTRTRVSMTGDQNRFPEYALVRGAVDIPKANEGYRKKDNSPLPVSTGAGSKSRIQTPIRKEARATDTPRKANSVGFNPFANRPVLPVKTPRPTQKAPGSPPVNHSAKRRRTEVRITPKPDIPITPKSEPKPIPRDNIQPPIFNFSLSDPTKGTIPRTLASCNTSDAFFYQARKAFELQESFVPGPVKKEGMKLLAVRVSWDGSKSISVVPWGSDDSWDAMMLKVNAENESRGGGLDVEVQCIGRS